MIEKVVSAMVEFNKGDARMVNHFLKAWAYSKAIGENEGVDEKTMKILEVAAVMHDIGIKPSMEKYGSGAGPYQEKEGPPIAKEMLERLGFEGGLVDRVCYLIGHHHTYTDIDGIDYQILVEADFLVNLDEKKSGMKEKQSVMEKIFKTKTGKEYLEKILMTEE